MKLNTIEEAINDIKAGKLVIIVDDENRENEGDFVIASEKITPEIINFMTKEGRGLICVSITEQRCLELDLDLMVTKNTSSHETPFTVSVDLKGYGCTTGVSAHDRAKTVLALINKDINKNELGRPGHIFPLKAKKNGVLQRAGHTEAAIDLAILAGFYPSGVLVEILNEDGSMARLPDLFNISQKFGIKIISIEDLISYRLQTDSLISREVEVKLPTKYGEFNLIAFKERNKDIVHLALMKGEWNENDEVLVRIHSSCITGDIFESFRCDCGTQLRIALELIEKRGQGLLLYLNQEGRGIGLINKLKAYSLQENGMDTVEANLALGFKVDERDYGIGAQILRNLNIKKIILLTNNPKKRVGLAAYDVKIVDTMQLLTEPNEHNKNYLQTKKTKMGHKL